MTEKITPDLQSCILCEEVRQEINGNFMLAGILGVITVPGLPISASKLCLFSRWCCGLGRFRHLYQLVLPDQTTVMTRNEGEFELPSVDGHVTQVTVFTNVQFQQPGIHWVEVHLDGELHLRFPLPVRVLPPQATAKG